MGWYLFNEVKELEIAWKIGHHQATQYTQKHVADIWARTTTLDMESLNDPDDEVPDYGQEDFAELRPLYPELSMLSDGALYAWFDVYQAECCYLNGWSANRDNDFLYYLLGKIAGRHNTQETARDIGRWIGYALLRGDPLDAAIDFGHAADLYDSAINNLARKIADAMRFLLEDKNETDLCGLKITTMMDTFRVGRSFNARTIQMTSTTVTKPAKSS